jgi:predicted TIM-barrel fold metal-dependent hydrolase
MAFMSEFRVDIHQHVWTEELLAALARRRWLPFVRRAHGLTVVHSAHERPFVVDLEAESPGRRLQLIRQDGLDLALVALSSPIGIETLARADARPLLDAHLRGVAALGPQFAAWGPVAVDRPDPDDVDEVLAAGCVGVSLPAFALSDLDGLAALRGVLERAAQRGVPVFVHPGPCGPFSGGAASLREPLWWRALTDYVSQMQAAWLTFATAGRREHPELRIVFAMLAGGAPLLSERLEARGGPEISLGDPLTFYDTSSYGPAAVEGMSRRVGAAQLVYGSDRPVIDARPSEHDTWLKRNSGQLVSSIVWGRQTRAA